MKTFHLTYFKLNASSAQCWGIKIPGPTGLLTVKFNGLTKREAIAESVKHLIGLGYAIFSLKIHRINGTIQEERTYPRKNDPIKSKG